jgi:hypothetical protein
MFFTLLISTFLLASLVSFLAVRFFDKPVATILDRIIGDEISTAWHRYIKFAAYVVGVSGGVRIYSLERYINAPDLHGESGKVLELNSERWVLEVYRTIIETLQSIAWMLLVVFVATLIAYVIVRGREVRQERSAERKE